MKAKRIALVVIEVEALPSEEKTDIMFVLNACLKHLPRESEIAAMKIFGADEARSAS